MGKFFQRVFLAVGQQARTAPSVILGVLFAILAAALGVPEAKQIRWLGAGGPAIFDAAETVLLILVIGLSLWFMAKVALRLKPSGDPVPVLRLSDFHCRILDTIEEAHFVNAQLVPAEFPDAPIPPDFGVGAQAKNPHRLAGLIETRTGDIVGWSSLWPVTAKAGQEIETGQRVDDDLTVDDLLPLAENGSAEYLILLSFAVLKPYRGTGNECLALKFGTFVISHIIQEFLCRTDRTIKLVATAYTAEGMSLCRHAGLRKNGSFADFGGKLGKKSIFVSDATIMSLTRRLGSGPAMTEAQPA